MFWGLILEPNKRYSQLVKRAFHISMATLDIKSIKDNNPTQVMLRYGNNKYILCTLDKASPQAILDLNFDHDSQITFVTNGNSTVHLTGYHILSANECDNEYCEYSSQEEDDDEELENGELVNEKSKKVCNGSKTERKRKHPSPVKIEHAKKEKKDYMEELSKDKKLSALYDNMEDDQSDTDDEDYEESIEEEEVDEEEEDSEEGLDEEEELDEEMEEEEEDDEMSSDEDMEENEKQKSEIIQKVNRLSSNKSKEETKNEARNLDKDKKNKKQKDNKKDKKILKRDVELKKELEQVASNNRDIPPFQLSGIQYTELKIGNGSIAKNNDAARIYYTAKLKDGKIIESVTCGKGFKLRLGHNDYLQGLDYGVRGMAIGGKRRIIVPPFLLKNEKGKYYEKFPKDQNVVFLIELVSLNGKGTK